MRELKVSHIVPAHADWRMEPDIVVLKTSSITLAYLIALTLSEVQELIVAMKEGKYINFSCHCYDEDYIEFNGKELILTHNDNRFLLDISTELLELKLQDCISELILG